MFDSRAKQDKLFKSVDQGSETPGLISAYTLYETARFNYHLSRPVLGTYRERLDALYWYLSSYSAHRKGPVPLSEDQVRFLNTTVPLIGRDLPLSVAAISFALNERGPGFALADAAQSSEVCFWWCVIRSPEVAFGDCLITPEMRAELIKPALGQETLEYGLNNFLWHYRAYTPELSMLDANVRDDRVVILVFALIASIKTRRIHNFLPAQSVKRLLKRDGEKSASLLAKLFDVGLDEINLTEDFRASELEAFLLRSLGGSSCVSSSSFSKSGKWRGASSARRLPTGMVEGRVEAGITVIGPFGAASGLGQATRLSADVLSLGVLPVFAQEFAWDNPAPVGFSTSKVRASPEAPTGINLFHLNAESLPMALADLHPCIYENSYNIGFFFWELSKIPRCHRLALEMLDEIWVASEYNREIYALETSVPVTNVGMAVEPLIDFDRLSRRDVGLPDGPYIFLTTFDAYSFIERKNPLASIGAFSLAFPSLDIDVRLVIKTQNRGYVRDAHQLKLWSQIDLAMQHDSRIMLIDETLTYRELLALKASCDCYVSLHRSEGLGFGMIEAMQLGLPVIATAYGGNMDFMTNDTAFPVRYTLVPALPGEYIFVERGSLWAEPDIGQAADLMRSLALSPARGIRVGEKAASHISREFSLTSICERYTRRIDKITDLLKVKK